jgi:Protein of unknown function (DUF4240)
VDRDGFWALVEAAGEAARWDAEGVADDLVCRLRELPVAELVDFDTVQRALLAESYRWDLWGAAYLLNGGCSGDCFEYFRAWLIAQGRAVYEAALRDPDSLAGHPAVRDQHARDARAFDGGELLAVAERAYEHATAGQAVPPLADLVDDLRGTHAAAPPSAAGEPFDFDDRDELRRRYPRLMALVDG